MYIPKIYGAIAMAVCMFVVGGVLGSYGTFLPNGLKWQS
jgi:hypothetical protein